MNLATPYEGAAVFCSTAVEPIVFQNSVNVINKSSSTLISTGDQSRIWSDMPMGSEGRRWEGLTGDEFSDLGAYSPNANITMISTGDGTKMCGGLNSITASFGSESNVSIDYVNLLLGNDEFVDDDNGFNKNCLGLTTGKGSTIQTGKEVAESVLISSGENSSIDDGGANNICISTGDNVDISTTNKEAKSTIFVTKESAEIASNNEALIFAKTSPKRFKVGKNSAVAIAWNDGSRERISVFYEGEGGLEADVSYRFENGNLIKL